MEDFAAHIGIPSKQVRGLNKAVQEGRNAPYQDARAFNWRSKGTSYSCVDTFGWYMYEYIAEDPVEIADRDVDSGHDVEYHDISEVLHVGEVASLVGGDSLDRATCSNKQVLPPKWIGNTRRQELFEHYQYWFLLHCEGEPASLTTFRTVLMAEWMGHLENTAPQATCLLQRMCPPFQATEQSRDS